MERSSGLGGESEVAVLVDYDNVFPPNKSESDSLVPEMNRWVMLARALVPTSSTLRIRLYGGWLEAGVLTNAASAVLSAIPRDYFPLAGGANSHEVIRGSVELATRLVGVPDIEWKHSFRTREGLPRLRLAQKPRPEGCINHDGCPIDTVQRLSRHRRRVCQHEGCAVQNEDAFLINEQKMVDALLSCDIIELARRGTHIVVMSNDLDVLPSIATIASFSKASVVLVRGSEAGDSDLYSGELKRLGVKLAEMEAA